MRALVVVLALLAPAALAGCAGSNAEDECESVVMKPLDGSLTPGETFVVLTVEVSNCGAAPIRIDAGPCGYDLLPRLERNNSTWVLKDGAALRPDNLDCQDGPAEVELGAGKTARISARWNGQVEREPGEFIDAPPGEYATRLAALNETVTGKVRVLG